MRADELTEDVVSRIHFGLAVLNIFLNVSERSWVTPRYGQLLSIPHDVEGTVSFYVVKVKGAHLHFSWVGKI